MFDNPVLRTLFLFLGVYFLLNFLSVLGWWAPALVILCAGVCAAVIWMYHYEYAALHRLNKQPWAEPVIRLVCLKVMQVQPPIGASLDADDTNPGVPAPKSGGVARHQDLDQDLDREEAEEEVGDEDQRRLLLEIGLRIRGRR